MTTVVLLDCKALGVVKQQFAIDHAQALLQYQKEKGIKDWELTPKSGYQFKDGTIVRTNKGSDKEPTEPAADSGSTGS